jgi:hypothetical protein
MALASTLKGTLSVSEYYAKMKKLVDEMEAVGKKLDPEKSRRICLPGWTWNTTRLFLLSLRVLSLSRPVNYCLRC